MTHKDFSTIQRMDAMTMTECIKREAAIKAIYESDHFSVRECFGWRAREIEEVLRAVPATPVPQWISVKDRLPENNERVLAFCIDHSVHDVVWSWPDNCWYDRGADVLTYKEGLVTHWMPPPELPKGEAE